MPKGSHSEFAQIKCAGICAQEKMRLAYLCERRLSGFKVCLVVGLNCGVHLDLIRLVFRLFDLDRLELVSRSRLDSGLRVTRTPRIRKPATCIYLRVITVPSASRVFSRPDTHAPHALGGGRSAPKPDAHGLQAWGASGPKAGRDGLRLAEDGCLTTYEACFVVSKAASVNGSVTMTSPLTWAE